uniref:Uncharacterized protein n=1 Tax=Oryza rufipogon TaxID=4529 RepID=A0A0E0PTE9_ORYRU
MPDARDRGLERSRRAGVQDDIGPASWKYGTVAVPKRSRTSILRDRGCAGPVLRYIAHAHSHRAGPTRFRTFGLRDRADPAHPVCGIAFPRCHAALSSCSRVPNARRRIKRVCFKECGLRIQVPNAFCLAADVDPHVHTWNKASMPPQLKRHMCPKLRIFAAQ